MKPNVLNKKQQIIFFSNLFVKKNLHFYFINIKGIKAFQQLYLRKRSIKNNINIKVVKNTLLKKSFKRTNNPKLIEIIPLIKENTTLLWSTDNKETASLLLKFTKKYELNIKPIFKLAISESNFFMGDQGFKYLINMKSKQELLTNLIANLGFSIRKTIFSLNRIFLLLCNLKNKIIYKYENKKTS
ncbi:50S ribosomal protein L10 [Candidatus Karelsulcia muelleri]